jgi:hypothetical protein
LSAIRCLKLKSDVALGSGLARAARIGRAALAKRLLARARELVGALFLGVHGMTSDPVEADVVPFS